VNNSDKDLYSRPRGRETEGAGAEWPRRRPSVSANRIRL
jgi:hypothetical protein